MSTFTGRTIANTYRGLLNIDNNNAGVDSTIRTVQDGEGTSSALQLSNSTVNINGDFQLEGVQLTANVSNLNALADITGVTGLVAITSGTALGRTLAAGTGVSITNANGTAGNPTIALNPTGITAATYGPVMNLAVNTVGQVTTISIPASISVAEIKSSLFTGQNLNISSNISATGELTANSAEVSIATFVSIEATKINATLVSCDTLNANNIIIEDFGASLNNFTANNLYVASSTRIVGMVSAQAAVFSGNVSAANLYADTNIFINGSAIPGPAQLTSINGVITALSATLATSIGNSNSAITALSATVATSIGTANTRITSVSDYAVALSATLATSIGNSNSAITALSATVATSIGTANTRITSVSDYAVALSATITSRITALSATVATSIGTANTRITSVSNYAVALSSTLATSIGSSNSAITALSATMATSIASRLPLAGGTITGTVSAQEVDVSSLGLGTVAGAKRLTMSGAAVAQYTSLTDAATIAVDLNTAQNFIVQLGASRALGNPTNCVAGQTGSIIVIQDGTGSRALSYSGNWKFIGGTAPTLSTAAGAIDRLDYIVYTSTAVQAIASLDIK
tara:strand:- start:107 stop:1849 length:1743 start_codon:yes stop_codon:yes gene_type:complete